MRRCFGLSIYSPAFPCNLFSAGKWQGFPRLRFPWQWQLQQKRTVTVTTGLGWKGVKQWHGCGCVGELPGWSWAFREQTLEICQSKSLFLMLTADSTGRERWGWTSARAGGAKGCWLTELYSYSTTLVPSWKSVHWWWKGHHCRRLTRAPVVWHTPGFAGSCGQDEALEDGLSTILSTSASESNVKGRVIFFIISWWDSHVRIWAHIYVILTGTYLKLTEYDISKCCVNTLSKLTGS